MINLKILSLLVGGLATTGGVITAIVKNGSTSKNSLQPEDTKSQKDPVKEVSIPEGPSEKRSNTIKGPADSSDNYLGVEGNRNSSNQTSGVENSEAEEAVMSRS